MWPWRKSFWEMPIRTLAFWAGVALLFYFTFWVGVDYGQTNQPFYNKILQGLRMPFGCASPQPPGAPTPPSVDYYTIMMARFPTEELAINFRTKLASERINSSVMAHGAGYYVTVGKFTSLGQAQNMLQTVRQKGYPSATILSPTDARF
ncbi:MAG: SPOR domain-containing protein [bacterium]